MINNMSLSKDGARQCDISIIIPVFNSMKTIKECLLAILNSKSEVTFEIIVVDDGSTDGSMGMIRDLPVKRIYQEHSGAAAARNLGSKKASSGLLLFVDSDVCFFEDN